MFNNQRKTLAKEYHELYMNNNTETRKNTAKQALRKDRLVRITAVKSDIGM